MALFTAGWRVRVEGAVRVPGDKSISHRALVCAALAEGRSRIRGLLSSADISSTAGVLRTLGASVPPLAAELSLEARGLRGLREPLEVLDCGNSGTTARLAAGIAAAYPFTSRFVGDRSLSRRPMLRVASPLSAMGAQFTFDNGDGLPMAVRGGALRGIEWATETASAQVKSAILLAGLVAGVPVRVREPARSRDHTELMLGAAGATVGVQGTEVWLDPVERLEPLDVRIPGDASSAAFFVALATLADAGELKIADVCLNETRVGFLRALQRMGARAEIELGPRQAGEPVGTMRVWPSQLRGIHVSKQEVPTAIDELPLLACVAARAVGTTLITGAAELRAKESDRIETTVSNLRALGIEAEALPDGMRVVGSDFPLRGRVVTHGDHRIAMAFGVLGTLPESEITLDDPGCVAVSYPGFWDDLRRLVRS